MSHEWADDCLNSDSMFCDETSEAFYCPYTNAAQCALVAKGWQPQEICQALECEQMKLFVRRGDQQNEAA